VHFGVNSKRAIDEMIRPVMEVIRSLRSECLHVELLVLCGGLAEQAKIINEKYPQRILQFNADI
jgi:hypothetical protein